QYAGPLIDAAGNAFEANLDLSVPEILHVLGDGVRKVGVGLNPIEKLGIALAVERTRLGGNAGGGLAFLPLPPIDREDFLAALILDPPDADDGHQSLRLGAN